jgi:hypothetical protein
MGAIASRLPVRGNRHATGPGCGQAGKIFREPASSARCPAAQADKLAGNSQSYRRKRREGAGLRSLAWKVQWTSCLAFENITASGTRT